VSAETDFRALLANHAPLQALVGDAIAVNAMEGEPTEYVVFTATHDMLRGLNSALLSDDITFTVQCWSAQALDAAAIADAVAGAVGTAPAAAMAQVTGRTDVFDEATGFDGVELTVIWSAV
jgi:hypothetical protein